MCGGKTVKHNMLLNSIKAVASVVLPLVVLQYVSRILEPGGVGRVYFALSFVSYFSILAQMGVPIFGIKQCASIRDDREALSKITTELLCLNIFLCIVVFIIYVLIIISIPGLKSELGLFLVVGISIVFSALNTDWLFQALEKYRYITIRTISFKLIALIMVFEMINSKDDYVVYAAIIIGADAASSILNLCSLKRYVDIRKRWIGIAGVKLHFIPAAKLFMLNATVSIYTNLDQVMIGIMKDSDAVGNYGTSIKIKLALVSLIIAVASVLMPRVSYYLEHNKRDECMQLLQCSSKFVFMLAMSLMVYFIIFASETIQYLAGDAFVEAVPAMQIIMLTLPVISISYLLGMQVLIPFNRDMDTVISAIIGAVIDVIANLLLIPRCGIAGAAVGTLLAEVGVLIYLAIKTNNIGIRIIGLKDIAWVVLYCGIAVSAALVVKNNVEGIFARLLIGAVATYAAFLLIPIKRGELNGLFHRIS